MGRTENYESKPAEAALSNLSGVAPYHPMTVKTFGDWAVEAGDKVKVSREEDSYTAPVHETKLIWKGQPEMELISTGNRKRTSVGKMEVKKYNSTKGRTGLRRATQGYNFEVNMRHLLYDVYNDYYGRLHAAVEFTSSKLRAQMENMDYGLYSYFEITAVQMYAEFDNKYKGLRSYIRITAEMMEAHFDNFEEGLYSNLEMTASRLRLEFGGLYDGLFSELEMTRSRLYLHFWGLYDGLHSEFELTRSRLRVAFMGLYDGLFSELELTRSRLAITFMGLYDGLRSELEMTRSRLSVTMQGMYDGLNSKMELTRSHLEVAFHGLYDGLNSRLELTRSHLLAEFTGLYDGMNSQLIMTRSSLTAQFTGMYDGLNSQLIMTRSGLTAQFTGLYDGLVGRLEMTRSGLYSTFRSLYEGLQSNLEYTASNLTVTFTGLYDKLGSRLEQTRSSFSAMVSDVVDENGKITAAQIAIAINKNGSNAYISADHIRLTGNTTVNGAMNITDNRVYITTDARINGDVMATSITLRSGNDDNTLTAEQLTTMIKSVSVSDGVLTFTKVNRTTVTYDRNVTLSPEDWSSGHLQVKAKQTNKNTSTGSDETTDVATFDRYIVDSGTKQNLDGSSYTSGNNTWYIPVNAKESASSSSSVATGLRIYVDASAIRTAGQNDVTVGDATWTYDESNVDTYSRYTNTATIRTVGRPSQLSKQFTIYLDTSASWSGTIKPIYVRLNNNSGTYLLKSAVSFSSRLQSITGYNRGYAQVTVYPDSGYDGISSLEVNALAEPTGPSDVTWHAASSSLPESSSAVSRTLEYSANGTTKDVWLGLYSPGWDSTGENLSVYLLRNHSNQGSTNWSGKRMGVVNVSQRIQESKTVSGSYSQQVVYPDSGYAFLKKVIVQSISAPTGPYTEWDNNEATVSSNWQPTSRYVTYRANGTTKYVWLGIEQDSSWSSDRKKSVFLLRNSSNQGSYDWNGQHMLSVSVSAPAEISLTASDFSKGNYGPGVWGSDFNTNGFLNCGGISASSVKANGYISFNVTCCGYQRSCYIVINP